MDKIEELLMSVPEAVFATTWGREAVAALKKSRKLLNQQKETMRLKEGQFLVTWEIDVFDATTAEEAARKAQIDQRNPFSHATVFEVTRADGVRFRVDLEELDEGNGSRDPARQMKEILDRCIVELRDTPIVAGKFARLMGEFEKRFREIFLGGVNRMVAGGKPKPDKPEPNR